MKLNCMKMLMIAGLMLSSSFLYSQENINFYVFAESGDKITENGLYFHSAGILDVEAGPWVFQAGMLNPWVDELKTGYGASGFRAGREFQASDKIETKAHVFYYHRLASDIIREENAGVMLTAELEHWDFALGNNSRRYVLRKDYRSTVQLNDSADVKVYEWRNVMYRICYQLKSDQNIWNLRMGITNYDYFLINQGTNPLLFSEFDYSPNSLLQFRISACYKGAGSMNLQADYFGFSLRGGVIWTIK